MKTERDRIEALIAAMRRAVALVKNKASRRARCIDDPKYIYQKVLDVLNEALHQDVIEDLNARKDGEA